MIKSILSLVLSASLIVGFAQTQWVTVNPENGRFSIEMPSTPDPVQQVVPSEIGEMTMNIHMLDISADDGDNMVMGLIYIDYPAVLLDSISTPEKVEEFFETSRDGAIANVGGSLISEKKIEIDGNTGMEYDISMMNNTAVIRMKYYLVGTRGYILQVISKNGVENNDDSSKFFDSFKLTE